MPAPGRPDSRATLVDTAVEHQEDAVGTPETTGTPDTPGAGRTLPAIELTEPGTEAELEHGR